MVDYTFPEEIPLTRIAVLFLSLTFASCLGTDSLAAQTPAAQAPEKPLTVGTIFAHGPIVAHPPEDLTWSPDGKHLTYLDGG